LARAIASDDVSGTVDTFCSFVEKNAAPMIAVMAVSGLKTAQEVPLGPHIRLVPLISLPPSDQRLSASRVKDAWGRADEPPHPAGAASSALVTDLGALGPIFHWATDVGDPSEAPRRRTMSALDDLHEARMLFLLLGMHTAMRSFWVQPTDPLMGTVATDVASDAASAFPLSAWMSPRNLFVGEGVEVNVEDAKQLSTAYFTIVPRLRREMLHIPLDRLDRAVREIRDLADASIDLGIALEALLLHKTDRGELKFRLSLRGAWLGGNDPTERADIQSVLGAVYDLRSDAVHTGRVDQTEKNLATIERGVPLCQRLIRRVIEEGGEVDWKALVLGGRDGPHLPSS
jgi:hypothetical protein